MVAKDIPATRQHQKMKQATLRKVLRRYREEVSAVRPMGRSKTSSIRFLEKCKIARMTACEIRSSDIIAHVRSRRQSGAGPSTANNDIVWLRVILRSWAWSSTTGALPSAARPMSPSSRRNTTRPTASLLRPTVAESDSCSRLDPQVYREQTSASSRLATRSTTLFSVSSRSWERETISATSASSVTRSGMRGPPVGPAGPKNQYGSVD